MGFGATEEQVAAVFNDVLAHLRPLNSLNVAPVAEVLRTAQSSDTDAGVGYATDLEWAVVLRPEYGQLAGAFSVVDKLTVGGSQHVVSVMVSVPVPFAQSTPSSNAVGASLAALTGSIAFKVGSAQSTCLPVASLTAA